MIRVVEFYSGIGGWCSALKLSGVSHVVVGAFDINGIANETYNDNYESKASSKSIETFTNKFLKKLDANLWVMSPPCQPYTRNNETETRDNNDPRSKSFLKLIQLIKELDVPPKYIALENVVGFEDSYCCDQFIQALRSLNYTLVQFHLTPTQFGLPNDRPRYYCIAERHGAFEGYSDEGKLLTGIPGVTGRIEVPSLVGFIDRFNDDLNSLTVPPSMVLKSSGWCFDIRSLHSQTTSCFTKSYARYIKGTGSVLLVQSSSSSDNTDANAVAIESVSSAIESESSCEEVTDNQVHQINNVPGERQYQEDWWQELLGNHGLPASEYTGTSDSVRLRFFSPKELTRLFGFPEEFHFPSTVPLRKQYELIGNSLNVKVACELLKYLLVKNCN